MSGADNVIFNTLERDLSSDHNNLQSMEARFLSDVLAQAFSRNETLQGQIPPASVVEDRVIGGLIASASATPNSVDVVAGAIAQQSATVIPVPGPFDSSYRLAVNRVTTTLAAPAPGGNTFYLLEAQMVNVVTSTVFRDIFDIVTGLFVSTSVPKLQERQIQFQFRAGTATQAPLPQANWVPIAIVFRLAAGGPVVASDIIDVRPLWNEYVPTVGGGTTLESGAYRSTGIPGAATTSIFFEFSIFDLGKRLYARATSGAVDLDLATYLHESGLGFVNNRLYYLYLFPWNELSPKGAYPGIESNGVLVLSAVPPNTFGRNSAPVTPPSPFAVSPFASSSGFCAASLYRYAGAFGYWSQSRSGVGSVINGDTLAGSVTLVTHVGPGSSAFNLDTIGAGGTDIVPRHARWVDLCISSQSATAFWGVVGAGGGTYANGWIGAFAGTERVRIPIMNERSFALASADNVTAILAGWGT